MEIWFDQRREKAVALAKARNIAGYLALVDAAVKPLGNEVDGADRVRRALGWTCGAARVTAQYPVKVLDASGAAAGREAGP